MSILLLVLLFLTTVSNVAGVVRKKWTGIKTSQELSASSSDDIKWFINKAQFGKEASNTYLCSTFYCRNLQNEKEALTLPDMIPVRSQSTIELHNGTMFRSPQERPVRLAVRPNNRMPEKNFPYYESGSNEVEEFGKNFATSKEDSEKLPTNDNSRIIAYNLPQESAKTGGNFSTGTYKTVTLGGLMRRMFFPDWLRDRLSINRNGDAMDASSIMSAVTTRPILSVPSVTFDSGLNRRKTV